MSLFAVKNEDGKYWDFEGMDDYRKPLSATNRGRKWAEEVKANTGGSEIIEVTENPAPIVVSEEEDKMLKKAKNTAVWRPAAVISAYAYDNTKDPDDEALLEDRLMRAYVIGWEVEKPKRWNVKVPHTKDVWYYKSCDGDLFTICSVNKKLRGMFTEAEIEHYGLQDCEKEEVTDDGMGC